MDATLWLGTLLGDSIFFYQSEGEHFYYQSVGIYWQVLELILCALNVVKIGCPFNLSDKDQEISIKVGLDC